MIGFLPFDISFALFRGLWIDLVEIGKLDTAYCNKSQRKQILEIVSDDKFILASNHDFGSAVFLIWLSKRCI
jgi:hypothetical protein